MTAKHILSFVLACLMLLPLLIACSDKPKDDKSGASTGSGETAVTETDTETEFTFPDAVGDLNFDGADFNIIQSSEKNWFYSEDLNGEKLNDAVFEPMCGFIDGLIESKKNVRNSRRKNRDLISDRYAESSNG